MSNNFEYLSGAINISAPLPDTLQENGLDHFYEDPNNAQWGDVLCRVLYHESIHFWQFLASGYIANLVSEEWRRLNHFEQMNEIIPKSDFLKNFTLHSDDKPFSPYELTECWARYWDVHTRSPARIIQEEKIEIERLEPIDKRLIGTYSWIEYDTIMQKGEDSHLYAQPYQWLLEKSSGNSYLIALLFPIITHASFGSPDPVSFFTGCFERATQADITKEIMEHRSGNINFDWINSWTFAWYQIVLPTLEEKNLPIFTSGFDVIQRGILGTHPIYHQYLEKAQVLWKFVKLANIFDASDEDKNNRTDYSMEQIENHAITEMAANNPWIIFALPGQPHYRHLLGHYLSPPMINFKNFTYSSDKVSSMWESGDKASESHVTFESQSNELEIRIKRFRAAEKAHSLGLPLNAFE
ncbi:hypothetical protein RE474_09170 [Methanolobus sediminis]|uniref:Uncharacterized protein n=1 Tax=Methanolobus sediminis TaxID=3072978 RepID=A0AA51YI92_9EURY|nr:hypothetical protein [Methanolobus sediminis]WMW24265.1 hypothetical protein RE474_09170 [Methanolobus sediminis]